MPLKGCMSACTLLGCLLLLFYIFGNFAFIFRILERSLSTFHSHPLSVLHICRVQQLSSLETVELQDDGVDSYKVQSQQVLILRISCSSLVEVVADIEINCIVHLNESLQNHGSRRHMVQSHWCGNFIANLHSGVSVLYLQSRKVIPHVDWWILIFIPSYLLIFISLFFPICSSLFFLSFSSPPPEL